MEYVVSLQVISHIPSYTVMSNDELRYIHNGILCIVNWFCRSYFFQNDIHK